MRPWIAKLIVASSAAFAAAAPAETLYGLTAGDSLARFDSASPGLTTTSYITGLAVGESLLGIDFRPADGKLYGMGSSNRLYTINTTQRWQPWPAAGPTTIPLGRQF